MTPIPNESEADSADMTESDELRYWQAASDTALREVWDNEEDAVYDLVESPQS